MADRNSSKRLSQLVGQTFGLLTVLSQSPSKKYGSDDSVRMWLCQCACGREKTAPTNVLRGGRTKSCGRCLRSNGGVTHGMTGTRTYRIWKKMRERCYNKNHVSYFKYGARGIAVCDEWRSSFWAFLADMGEAPAGKSLDRINTYGNYEPSNCRWLTPKEQARNARHNVWVEVHGQKMIITDAAVALGTSTTTLQRRIAKGLLKRGAPPC